MFETSLTTKFRRRDDSSDDAMTPPQKCARGVRAEGTAARRGEGRRDESSASAPAPARRIGGGERGGRSPWAGAAMKAALVVAAMLLSSTGLPPAAAAGKAPTNHRRDRHRRAADKDGRDGETAGAGDARGANFVETRRVPSAAAATTTRARGEGRRGDRGLAKEGAEARAKAEPEEAAGAPPTNRRRRREAEKIRSDEADAEAAAGGGKPRETKSVPSAASRARGDERRGDRGLKTDGEPKAEREDERAEVEPAEPRAPKKDAKPVAVAAATATDGKQRKKKTAGAEERLADRALKEGKKAVAASDGALEKKATKADAPPAEKEPAAVARPPPSNAAKHPSAAAAAAAATNGEGRNLQKEDKNLTPEPTVTPSPTPKPTKSPTRPPTRAPTPEPTPPPVRTLSPVAPIPGPTPRPTPGPTPEPTGEPTPEPTPRPTPRPTKRPRTKRPTPGPTPEPTPGPTAAPTTAAPTVGPTGGPTWHPVAGPTTGRPTVGPSTGGPTGTPTGSPSSSPSSSPTGAPTEGPSEGDGDVDGDGDGSDASDNATSTAQPPTASSSNDTGVVGVSPSPASQPANVRVSADVLVTLRTVPSTMDVDEGAIYVDACAAFLGELFRIGVPPYFDVECQVKGQNLVTSRRRLLLPPPPGGSNEVTEEGEAAKADAARSAEGGGGGNGLRRAQGGDGDGTYYPLEVDTAVTAAFVPTDRHPDASSVDFAGRVRNSFTVSGGVFVEELRAQSAEYEKSNGDPEQMRYFAEVRDVEGTDPDADADADADAGGGTGGDPAKREGDGGGGGKGGGSNTGWLVAVIVGSVVFVGLVGAIFFMMRKKKNAPGSGSARSSKRTKKDADSSSSEPEKNTPSKLASNGAGVPPASPDSPSDLSPRGGSSNLVDVPPYMEEASDNGSLAHLQNLDSMSYAYSLDDGLRVSNSVSYGVGSGTVGYNEVEEEYEVGMNEEGSSLAAGSEAPSQPPTNNKAPADGAGAAAASPRENGRSVNTGTNPFDGDSFDQEGGNDTPNAAAQRHSSNLISSVLGKRGGGSKAPKQQQSGASARRVRSSPSSRLGTPQSQDISWGVASGGLGGSPSFEEEHSADAKSGSSTVSKSDLSRLQQRLSKRGIRSSPASSPPRGGGPANDDATFVTLDTAQGMVRRDCWAPPGKLGVVIDSTPKGPVVHEVKGGSPLEGAIFAGDRIIAVDDNDTRSMTASAVTKMMARKMDQRRKITVLSVVTGAN